VIIRRRSASAPSARLSSPLPPVNPVAAIPGDDA
jgi:hypothetical protein